ncbi:MAG: glycosyltransferase family 87 protein [Candidatus Dormibacteria bacterium]
MTSAAEGGSLEELLGRRGRRLRHLVLLVALGWVVGLAAFALFREFPPQPGGVATNYRILYAAAAAVRDGANPYHLAAIGAVEQMVYHYPALRPAIAAFGDLPASARLMMPLSLLPFWLSYALASALGVFLVILTLTLLARDLGWRHTGVLAAAAILSWVGLLGFLAGQLDAVLFAALAGSMLLAWHERGLAAGLVLGVTLITPTLLWPVPVFMFLALWPERRRALHFAAGYLLAAAVLAGASWSLLPSWWRALLAFGAGIGARRTDLASLPGLVAAAPSSWGLGRGVTATPTLALIALAVVGMAVFGVWMMISPEWRRVSPVGRVTWAVALPVGIWLLASPYAHPNDDLLLLPLLMVTVGRDARRIHGLGLGLSAATLLLLLLVWPLGLVPWQVGVPILGGLGVAVWLGRTDLRLTGYGAGLCVLTLAVLPPIWGLHLLVVGLTPVAVLVLVVEGARTCWMEVGGAGTGPAYFEEPVGPGIAGSPSGA